MLAPGEYGCEKKAPEVEAHRAHGNGDVQGHSQAREPVAGWRHKLKESGYQKWPEHQVEKVSG